MVMLKWSILGVILVLTLSCTKNNTNSLYTPSISDVTANATLADLQQGRTLYINNCGRCHGLYSPDDLSGSQWKTVIPNMAPKTGLSSSDISLIIKYTTRGQ